MNLKCVGIIYFVLNLGRWMMNNRFVRGKHILTEVILPAVSVANYIIIEKASVRCLPPVLPRSLANQTSQVNLRDFMFGYAQFVFAIRSNPTFIFSLTQKHARRPPVHPLQQTPLHLYTVGQSLSSTTSYATFYSTTSTLQFGSGNLNSGHCAPGVGVGMKKDLDSKKGSTYPKRRGNFIRDEHDGF